MSAYASDGSKSRGSQLIALPGSPIQASDEDQEKLPVPPRIADELESYFRAAKRLESKLAQEKLENRKLLDQIRELQLKTQNYQDREVQFQSQLIALEKTQEELKKATVVIAQERYYRERYQKELQQVQARYSHLYSTFKTRLEHMLRRDRGLIHQLSQLRESKRVLQNQSLDLSARLERAKDEAKKKDIQIEILHSNLEHSQRTEHTNATRAEDLSRDLKSLQEELRRYKSAWQQMGRQAKDASQKTTDLVQKLEELSETVSSEKRKNEYLEELMRKEKRDKHLALTCLHTAESKLAQLSQVVENLEKQRTQTIQETGLELKF
jgi:chromosome segregation ATPase